MAQADGPALGAVSSSSAARSNLFRKIFRRQSVNENVPSPPPPPPGGDTIQETPKTPQDVLQDESDDDDPLCANQSRRISRKVIPGLPRAQTLKRQHSEKRNHLALVEPSSEERRAVSVDRRSHEPSTRPPSVAHANPRASAPSFLGAGNLTGSSQFVSSLPLSPSYDELFNEKLTSMLPHAVDMGSLDYSDRDAVSAVDTASITTSQFDRVIHDELERIWILNLSMHFRDRSKREKFFVTYREKEHLWRRVTISVDYRDAPPESLEMDLLHTRFQKDKNAKIYEAIRESLRTIQFYDTVTNLKLQTTDDRLHVHVVEDGNEIIPFPTVACIQHLGCPRVKERDITFDSHMSGFVYKVEVDGKALIKKEIPSPDTVDEFLYEVNALSRLRFSRHVIRLHGVVVDDHDQYVKGLLISYADHGALVDIVYDHRLDTGTGLPWATRERWARQIVQGLADIHESGFVQGDFTLSNIVIDNRNDARIIDINRRGCPVGWEPPEVSPLIESNQRISMYIGVKSDLFQLGMVLWALAMQEDEPEAQGRPLMLGPEVNVPDWYRQITEICLSDDPRFRAQASTLLAMFPPILPPTSVGNQLQSAPYTGNGILGPQSMPDQPYIDDISNIVTVEPPQAWFHSGETSPAPSSSFFEPYYQPRGRSPPRPRPGEPDEWEALQNSRVGWAANIAVRPSYSDAGADEPTSEDLTRHLTPKPLSAYDPPAPVNASGETVSEEVPNAGKEASPAVKEEELESGNEPPSVPQILVPEHHETEEAMKTDDMAHAEANNSADSADATGTLLQAKTEQGSSRLNVQVSSSKSDLDSSTKANNGSSRPGSSQGFADDMQGHSPSATIQGSEGADAVADVNILAGMGGGDDKTSSDKEKSNDMGNTAPIADGKIGPRLPMLPREATAIYLGDKTKREAEAGDGSRETEMPAVVSETAGPDGLSISRTSEPEASACANDEFIGIGAAHVGGDDQMLRETPIDEVDFGISTPPIVGITSTITTDARD